MQKVTTVRENVGTGKALCSSWFGELRLGMRQSKVELLQVLCKH